MATYSSRRPNGPILHRHSSPATSSVFASFCTAAFSSHQSPFFHPQNPNPNPNRSNSPTRISLMGRATALRSQILTRRQSPSSPAISRKNCLCSPTTHPGSFRCSLHKGFGIDQGMLIRSQAVSSPSNRLNMRRSAMMHSLVRIGTVEGEIVNRALAALIRPSSHQQRRRAEYQARPIGCR